MNRRGFVYFGLTALSSPCAAAEDQASATSRQAEWAGTVALNAARRDGGETGAAQLIALTRQTGRSTLRATLSRYRGTVRQLDNETRPTFAVATLGWGHRSSTWFVDLYASSGRQTYGTITQAGVVRTSTGPSTSPYWAAGGSVGRVFRPTERWYLTASGSLNYAYSRVLRPGPLGRRTDRDSSEPALGASATLRIDRQLDRHGAVMAGTFASVRATTNAASDFSVAGRGTGPSGGGLRFDQNRQGDHWVEGGLTLMLPVTRRVSAEGYVSRSFGERVGSAVNAGFSLRIGL
ncbi:hypothetical protein [Novosphingobium sp.]|uniref:hypothetical protein n=1 Tax=Novosphingobium sp. TaxID=1874826 RepID=UPI002623E72E|nr:hypothetical protein [Novosphingobium sp.]